MKPAEKAPQTAPNATLSQDLGRHGLRAAGRGVCTCGPSRAHAPTFADCTCEWGALIRTLLYVGYNEPTEQAAKELLELSWNARDTILGYRPRVYQGFADAFQGTVDEFCSTFKLSRAVFYRMGLRIKETD